MARSSLRRFALATIAINLLVILWGAWVRLSGSGAGCGAHWPLCDGKVLPGTASTAMLIEFAHRATSGLALLLVCTMVWLARRDFPVGHAARRWAWTSLAFIVMESLIGAGLVLFRYVEDNQSLGRALWLGGHLLNTLLMLGAFWLTYWTASGGAVPAFATLRRHAPLLLIGLAALLFTGMSGAVASLGDMLFPSASLGEGFRQDLAPAAHLLVKLRVWHPVIAITSGLLWLTVARRLTGDGRTGEPVRRAAGMVVIAVLVQWTIGASTLILLVPVLLQLLHLLTADLLWLAAIRLTVTALADQAGRTSPAMSRAASASNTRPAPLSR